MSYIGNKLNSRTTWGVNPITKVVPSEKKYDRNRDKSQFQKELDKATSKLNRYPNKGTY